MIQNLATNEMLQSLKEQIMKELFDEKYPVGSGHYIQFQGMPEPSVAFAKYGATWTRDNGYAGRVIVGSGTSETGTVYLLGATGGSEDAVLLKHKHEILFPAPLFGDHADTEHASNANCFDSKIWQKKYSYFDTELPNFKNFAEMPSTALVDNPYGRNMQPYKVVGVWKRTA